jgi:aspartyl-tRNA synthetase
MCGYNDIREIIAFPKNKNAECPMDGSPNDVPDEQLKELNIKLDLVKRK